MQELAGQICQESVLKGDGSPASGTSLDKYNLREDGIFRYSVAEILDDAIDTMGPGLPLAGIGHGPADQAGHPLLQGSQKQSSTPAKLAVKLFFRSPAPASIRGTVSRQ